MINFEIGLVVNRLVPYCKDSICNDPQVGALGSNTKGPNNKFVENELKG